MNATLPRRVLAIGAHPDDIELLCAGTLAAFLAAGSAVHLAVACRGDRGGDPDADRAGRRRDEARHAAEILGAPIVFLEFGDAEVTDTTATRIRFMQLLCSFRPDLVLTHSPDDYHEDHVRVSELVSKCSWFAASPGHETGQPPLEVPPALFYMDTVAAIGFEPTHLVDISATIEIKRKMLACHENQLARRDSGFPSLIDLAETQARLRGFQCGTTHAEGFRPALLWGRRRAEPVFP